MAYRSVVEEVPGSLKRTVLGTFDFQGRSTRTELITFFFIPQIAVGIILVVLSALSLDGDFDTPRRIGNILNMALMVPLPALFVRRLHDQGRTGWWLLLLIVSFAFAIVSDNGNPDIEGIAKFETPFWLDLIFVGAILALWGFSLWPPNDDANRYGPNPRLVQDELPA